MKKMLLLLLAVLLCLNAYTPAYAAYMLAFGESTPTTNDNSNSGFGGSTPDNNSSDTSSNNAPSGNSSGGSSSSGNSSGSSSSSGNSSSTGAQPGGTIVDQYESNAYVTEKSAEQKLIEELQQLYGGPRLTSLSVGGLALIPLFSAETFYYTVYVPEGQSSVSISAGADSGSVYIDGVAARARQIAMGSEAQTVIVTVTSQSGSTTYSVALLRASAKQADFPVLTHVRLDNTDFFYEQDITTLGGDIYITLPQASKKSFNITLSTNIEVWAYCNNIRVYNEVYNTQAGAWQFKRQGIALYAPETRLEILLADRKTKAVQNTYYLILQQPGPQLNIQLQVGNEQALVNNVVHNLDAPPQILGGSTMVPLRFIAEALGAEVSWHSEEMRVELNWQGQKLELFIGRLTDNMPQAPFIENGRTMVPLRYVSERLDCQVEWLEATREIIITR